MQIKTIEQFVEMCRDMSNDAIHEMFEDNCTDEPIIEIYSFAPTDTPEPTRAAFNELGVKFNVQSLIDY